MDRIQKTFGFGCMRLPMTDNHTVDIPQMTEMVDTFLAAGFNYFDTAHGYLDGQSETALRQCLTSRYPRERYILTDKLSQSFFKTEEDIRPFFESQLKILGVSYFDFYLMHSQNKRNFEQYRSCHAYETAFALKKEGKIRHVGLSFHDSPDMLETILQTYPDVEVVQLQLNYLDWDSPSVQSQACLEICRKYQKPVIVMEPVKGGLLADLPEDCISVLQRIGNPIPASLALRFTAGCPNVFMTLSGMSNMEQMKQNIGVFSPFVPLSDKETAAIADIVKIFKLQNTIPCTGCAYCVAGCPKNIAIPHLFACLNMHKKSDSWNEPYYYRIHTANGRLASTCIKCGKCEAVCPQHLPIRQLLTEVAKEFEK